MNAPATKDSAPLRVLQLNTRLSGGGTDDQCVKLTFALQQLNQQVEIAGPDGRDFSKIIQESSIPFFATPSEGFLKLAFIRAAAARIRRERIQIVHGHHGRDLWPTILAARMSGVSPKIVLSRHLAKSPGSFVSQRWLLAQCDALIAVSEFTRRVLCEGVYEPDSPEEERRVRPPIRGDQAKIKVVYGGIDTSRFKPGDASALRGEWNLKPEHYVFAVAGSYDFPRGKGQREFLQAAARIHEKMPRARFLIIGRGGMAEVLRADIYRLGLSEKAWLTPYCRDMPLAMNAIDCLVHPQVGTEAFGLVVLEAFACGKPVIASALDGIPEAFAAASFGRLVKPESVEELAEAMAEWAGRPGLAMAEKMLLHQRIDEKFSLTAAGKNMLALYRQLFAS